MIEHGEEDYLSSLNPPQREGVVNVEGPTMIIAGAGSGKTRVLTFRIAHLIKAHNVDPFSIMSLTFTNRAAMEMRKRIEREVGTDARNLWMGTFHSVFSRILRAEAGKLGFPSNFTIYDTDDSKSLIKSIVKEMGLDDKVYKPNVVYNRISSAKNRLISWREYLNNPIFREDDESNMKPEMGKLYKTYVERCFKADAMDFDDLLFYTNVLFRDHLDVLNKYQHRFRYLLIDEFQDTNVSQYLIAKKLAAVTRNICVVGDDAQSIYAFRGADIQNILNFEKDYPELHVIKLEQNYRSTQMIVNAANSVIKNNKAQLEKSVWTSNGSGSLIDLIKATSDNEEGRLVASAIFEEKVNKQLRNSDFAILYRTNSQSRAMEEALRRANLRYKIIGGLSFYQRKEIKDIISYIRFVINPNDEQAMRRIINLPKRGIGPGTIEKIIVASNDNNVSIWDVIQHPTMYLTGRVASVLDQFATLIKSFQLSVEKRDAYEAASLIAKNSGLLKELYDDKTVEGLNRYENVQELLNAIKEFTVDEEREDRSLGAFLQEVALLADADTKNDDDDDYITLMTIHSAKGLEFKNVFIVGMEEDLFPSQMMLSSRADLEEERRLFYVAITRAEQKLSLSYALNRYRFGRLKNCEPSRFLEEI
ncbi:MAG: UvrD-helicase domain-containing protein, partial [Bacteroidota bacterium]